MRDTTTSYPGSDPRTKKVGLWLSIMALVAAALVLAEHALNITDATMVIVYAVGVPLLLGAFVMVMCVMFRAPPSAPWLVALLTIAGVLFLLYLEYQSIVESFRHPPFG